MGRVRPAARAGRRRRSLSAAVRIGTCSWADETLTKTWYPSSVRTAEARLHHYAEQFDTVELNASYYALPSPDATAAWARRTPPGFVFHVKAFGMMTRHPVRAEQLPADLRAEAQVDDRGRVDHPSRELRGEVFTRFRVRARAAARGRQAGRDPDAVPGVRRPQAGLARVPGVGQGAPRRRRDDGRVPAPQLARAGARLRHARVPALAGGDLRDGRCAPHRRPQPGADGRRRHLADGVPAPARPQRRHVERARPQRGRALRLPVLAPTSWPSGRSRCASSRRSRSAPTPCSTTMAAAPARRGPIAQAPTNAHMLREILRADGVPVTDSPRSAPA